MDRRGTLLSTGHRPTVICCWKTKEQLLSHEQKQVFVERNLYEVGSGVWKTIPAPKWTAQSTKGRWSLAIHKPTVLCSTPKLPVTVASAAPVSGIAPASRASRISGREASGPVTTVSPPISLPASLSVTFSFRYTPGCSTGCCSSTLLLTGL